VRDVVVRLGRRLNRQRSDPAISAHPFSARADRRAAAGPRHHAARLPVQPPDAAAVAPLPLDEVPAAGHASLEAAARGEVPAAGLA
jgi:hypothetical protein